MSASKSNRKAVVRRTRIVRCTAGTILNTEENHDGRHQKNRIVQGQVEQARPRRSRGAAQGQGCSWWRDRLDRAAQRRGAGRAELSREKVTVRGLPNSKHSLPTLGRQLKRPASGRLFTEGGSSRRHPGAQVAATNGQERQPPGATNANGPAFERPNGPTTGG